MGGERVPQRVRVQVDGTRGLGGSAPGPYAQATPNVGRAQPPARLGEKQRVGEALLERRSAPQQVALDRAQGVLARGHDPRLAPLSLDAHALAVEVDRADV